MCTMTLAPLKGPRAASRLRIAFNRDESRVRPAARPPELRRCGGRLAMMPVDPVSNGTWIAANDAGLVAALLNVYGAGAAGRESPSTTRSRGEIIPTLMQCATIDAALEWTTAYLHDDSPYAPFTLVLTDGRRLESRSKFGDGDRSTSASPIARAQMFTSSGLGDALVRAPRQRLFDEMFATPADVAATQDAYHRCQWPDHPELSVCMARDDARTVSFTVLELDADTATMTYHAGPPNEPSDLIRLTLHLDRPA